MCCSHEALQHFSAYRLILSSSCLCVQVLLCGREVLPLQLDWGCSVMPSMSGVEKCWSGELHGAGRESSIWETSSPPSMGCISLFLCQ